MATVTTLADLYNADLRRADRAVRAIAEGVMIPHPLHGVDYADGVILCGRGMCRPCRDYRATMRAARSESRTIPDQESPSA